MKMELPNGSKIHIETTRSGKQISIPFKNTNGFMKFAIALFLLVWLVGWTFGFINVLTKIMSGEGTPFEMVWLAGWTVGGFFATYFFYRIVRKPIPAVLHMNSNSIEYDSGVKPIQFSNKMSQKDAMDMFYGRRKKYTFPKHEIESVKLRDTSDGNRLTIDHNNERIDLAEGATEIEKEWLYKMMIQQYEIQ